MEKKKIVKPLVIATAVAAVAGIGAVSFAAWNNANSKTANVNGNTLGSVTLFGFDGDGTAPTAFTGLLPSNQPDAAIADTRKEMTLPAVVLDSATAYTVTVTATPTAAAGNTLSEGLKLYVVVQDSADAAPELTDATWKEVGSTAVFNFSTETSLKAYFKLSSESTADMNATYDIVFTAADTTPAA